MNDDIDRIMAVMDCAFDPYWGEAWNRRQVTDSLGFPNTHYILAGYDGEAPALDEEASGFVLSRAAPDEEELLLIAVRAELQGLGIGTRLLERFKTDAKIRGAQKLFLEMRCNNPAERSYRRAGFEPIGKRPNYYRLSDGSRLDAITFGLEF